MNAFYHIEDSNAFSWQKNMNEEEFEQLKKGMTYLDVVHIAKGRGQQINDHKFIWNDELLFTKAYEITFEENRLVDKKIIKKSGYSNR